MNMRVCNKPVRGGGSCLLEPDHGGYHSVVTFYCDGCGNRRRGTPQQYIADMRFCFICVKRGGYVNDKRLFKA